MMQVPGILHNLKLFMLPEARKTSFAYKVFKVFFIFVLAVTIIVTFLAVRYQTGRVMDDLNSRGKTMAILLANSCRTGVFAENQDLLNDAADGILSQSGVLKVSIFSSSGKELLTRYSSVKKDSSVSGDVPEPLAQGQIIEFAEPVIIEQRSGSVDELYFSQMPVKTEKTTIGQVRISLDSSAVPRVAKAIVVRSSIVAGVFLIIGTAFIVIVLQNVLRPLSQLTEEVRLFGEGQSIEQISVKSEDEIGRLAKAFNEMAENLKRREDEARNLEQQLRHAQKMEAVGTLARGIAHDFNNILTTAQASIYIMQKKIDKTDSMYGYVSRLNSSISRAKMLVQSLLTFSRGQTVKLFPIEINAIISNMEPMVKAIIGDSIDCSMTFPDTPLVVMADSTQMEQVLLNLASNAKDAMVDGGTLTITVERVDIAAGDRISRPGAYARIEVADTGSGISEDLKERIFEPFFTTKEVGKGTGLGLSIVYGIIEQHHGYIFVDSGPVKGAIFSIYLPLFEKNGHLVQDA